MPDASTHSRRIRRNAACDECKRRKVRCSADPVCRNCARDRKTCIYSSPSHRVTSLEQRLAYYEHSLQLVRKAWATYLPDVPFESIIGQDVASPVTPDRHHDAHTSQTEEQDVADLPRREGNAEPRQSSITDLQAPEQTNAEDYEFDESQDQSNSIDGMAFLTSGTGKSGYTGPQSGIAALKLLQSLPFGRRIEDASDPMDMALVSHSTAPRSAEQTKMFVDDYFKYYHPAYPLLHEGLFYARLSGAVAKPRDGSWTLLLNMVAAMGAFSGQNTEQNVDWEYYLIARESISLSVVEKGSLCYVQGLTIMANYLQKRNKPNAGFALIGIAWSMALAIGLHREFTAYSTATFTMELRRRTWWTLFCFVSGAQLTLGRPPASLVGINLRHPTNLDDGDLSVDMTEIPVASGNPTTSSCIIAQIRLAQIANAIQAELLTNQVPARHTADLLRQQISSWQDDLPGYFSQTTRHPAWFEYSKRVLLWRAFHLRIVLDRPFLFKAIAQGKDLSNCDGPAMACINTAETCVSAICRFIQEDRDWGRGFAWYATYWLITASFVHATCFAYTASSNSSNESASQNWKEYLEKAVQALQLLGSAHPMADRARRVLERLIGSTTADYDSAITSNDSPWNHFDFADLNMEQFGRQSMLSAQPLTGHLAPYAHVEGDSAAWQQLGNGANAEFIDAAGGMTLQNLAYPWQQI